jgi:hypothetical protein
MAHGPGRPDPLRVMQIAGAMGESLDSEALHNATQTMHKTWMKGKYKLMKYTSGPYEPVLPKEFQPPDAFRRKMEQKSAPIPQLNVPPLPLYIIFIAALAYWCYYGYQYNETHFPVSLTVLIEVRG